MKLSRSSRIYIAIGVFLLAYVVTAYFEIGFWMHLFATACPLFSFGLIYQAYSESREDLAARWVLRFFVLANLAWITMTILYVFYSLFDVTALYSQDMIMFAHTGTSFLLLSGCFVYSLFRTRRWNAIQLFVDTIAISISMLLLIWILLFDQQVASLMTFTQSDWLAVANLIITTSMVILLLIWFISIREGTIPVYLRFATVSLLLYVAADFTYFYAQTNNIYINKPLFDTAYLIAFLGIGMAATRFLMAFKDKSVKQEFYSNIGYRHKGLLLLHAPILIIVFRGFSLTNLFIYVMIIFLHEGISCYIQAAIQNELLLRRQKNITSDLEKAVSEHTQELVEKNDQLNYLSCQDTVTSLYNRRYFLKAVDDKICDLKDDETLAVIYLDIDRFKIINDSYGHYVGDLILVELSKRLKHFPEKDAIIARPGGDEFAIATTGNYSYERAAENAKIVIELCAEPIIVDRFTFRITVSVGISLFPLDAKNSDMLMRNADMAMFQAKREGYNRVVTFNENLRKTIHRKNELEILLRSADFEKEFELYYQPQFLVPDQTMFAMEALLRWKCPSIGEIFPDEFVPLAEETDMIIPIGEWVLNKACEQISNWNRSYGKNYKMCVNVSPKQLDQTGFIDAFRATMDRHACLPDWLEVEVTEGVAAQGIDKVKDLVNQIKDMGVTVAIDDFGTGYSSLSYLKFFPFNRVKIARELVDNIVADPYDLQIVRSIIILSDSLGFKAIAEGVETRQQFDLLHHIGCKQMQGYNLGKPMPKKEFEAIYLQ